MRPHLRYAWYVCRHKWYVFLECCHLGIPWAGITHDLSKFRPSEWFAYVESFYGGRHPTQVEVFKAGGNCLVTALRDRGHRFQEEVQEAFDYAWLHHQRRNPHHWQYWLLVQDEDAAKVLEMPLRYRKEMLADWRGAGRAQGTPNTLAWYNKNKAKMQLAPETRKWVEKMLEVP